MSSYGKEAEAAKQYAALMEAAEACRMLFIAAGLPCPTRLERFFAEEPTQSGRIKAVRRTIRRARQTPSGAQPAVRRAAVEFLPPGSRPDGVPENWIGVPISEMKAQTFVLASLKHGAAGPKDILREAEKRGFRTSEGVVANVGARLEQKNVIIRDAGEWALLEEEKAPLLNGRAAWGPAEAFSIHEQAGWRREMIRLLLGHFPKGLQNREIVARLGELPWLDVPVNKDLVKMDLEALLDENKVQRVKGDNRKWTLVL